MKEFIEERLNSYKSLYQHPVQVLEHLFCVLGNGVRLTLKGYLEDNYTELVENNDKLNEVIKELTDEVESFADSLIDDCGMLNSANKTINKAIKKQK